MLRTVSNVILFRTWLVGGSAAAPVLARPDDSAEERLLVLIVVDQLRSDYLTRWTAHFTGGFAYLLENGAYFPNAYVSYGASETAPGHATIATGCVPRQHGIVGNKWYRQPGVTKAQQPVHDPATKLVGADEDAPGISPWGVARAFPAKALSGPAPTSDDLDHWLAWRSCCPGRSGQFFIRLVPGWVEKDRENVSAHACGSRSDRHVPILLAGRNVQAGWYYSEAGLRDIAPTLAAMLGIEPPSEAVGRVLGEALRTASRTTRSSRVAGAEEGKASGTAARMPER